MAVKRFKIGDYVKVVGFAKRGEWQNDYGDIMPMLTMEGTHEASVGNCYTVTGVCTGRGPALCYQSNAYVFPVNALEHAERPEIEDDQGSTPVVLWE